jgi:hypothetical protein
VSIDEQHVALPKLYGAPAYARPPRPVVGDDDRPFDPDDLPLEAVQSEEDRAFAATLPPRAWAPGGAVVGHGSTSGFGDDASSRTLGGRSFSLRAIAGKLLNPD